MIFHQHPDAAMYYYWYSSSCYIYNYYYCRGSTYQFITQSIVLLLLLARSAAIAGEFRVSKDLCSLLLCGLFSCVSITVSIPACCVVEPPRGVVVAETDRCTRQSTADGDVDRLLRKYVPLLLGVQYYCNTNRYNICSAAAAIYLLLCSLPHVRADRQVLGGGWRGRASAWHTWVGSSTLRVSSLR